jgi:type I restriction enzyme, S subunit
MQAFELSPSVDTRKVFLIRRAQLEGRIDPHQYHHERLAAIAAVRKNNQTVPLYQAIKGGKSIATEISPNDMYIGLENIVGDTGEYVASADKQSISSAGIFKKGQILFPKLRPYLNKVHLAQFDGLCSTEFHVLDSTQFDPDFLAIYLRSNLILSQTRHLMTGNTLPRLQTQDIYHLPIPLVTRQIQRQVVESYQKATLQRQQKEQQALALLAGIDGYLLNELGITLPQQDNRLEKRMFTVGARELSGGRLDPSWSLNAHYRIEGGKYPNQFLNHIATVAKGTSITSADVIEGQYPVVAGGQSSPYTHNAFNHTENVITVSASGAYAGYVWHHDYKIFASDCTVIRSKNEANVSTEFLFELLKLKQKEIYFLQQGAGQPHVYSRDLAVLKLPLPPPAEQAAMLKPSKPSAPKRSNCS